MHEASLYDFSSFVTLTYDEDSCPVSLRYSDFQKFMKRLRKLGPVRFFAVGEYGAERFRPHFHALLFGVFFPDREVHSERGGVRLYRSERLSSLWPHGFASVGDVTYQSAAYCARYVLDKVTGPLAEDHYKRVIPETGEVVQVVPEFCRMSLKPGIGARWFERYRSEVFGKSFDRVVVEGREVKPPRFYKQLLARVDPDLEESVDLARYVKSGQGREDRTPERLAVREAVLEARLKFYRRTVE